MQKLFILAVVLVGFGAFSLQTAMAAETAKVYNPTDSDAQFSKNMNHKAMNMVQTSQETNENNVNPVIKEQVPASEPTEDAMSDAPQPTESIVNNNEGPSVDSQASNTDSSNQIINYDQETAQLQNGFENADDSSDQE